MPDDNLKKDWIPTGDLPPLPLNLPPIPDWLKKELDETETEFQKSKLLIGRITPTSKGTRTNPNRFPTKSLSTSLPVDMYEKLMLISQTTYKKPHLLLREAALQYIDEYYAAHADKIEEHLKNIAEEPEERQDKWQSTT